MLMMVNHKFIEMEQSTYKVFIEEIMRMYRENGLLGIIAVTPGQAWNLKLETYCDRYQLELAIRRYRRKGNTVIAVRE